MHGAANGPPVRDQTGVQRSKIDGAILFSVERAGCSKRAGLLRTFWQQVPALKTKSENRRERLSDFKIVNNCLECLRQRKAVAWVGN